MKSTTTKLALLFACAVQLYFPAYADTTTKINSTDLTSISAVASNVADDIDGRPYGDGSWIGYVFTNPITNFEGPSFDNAVLQGTITENATFNRDWGGTSGPTVNGTTYIDYFLIRYKMTKNLTKGRYYITLGGDDGMRLSINGGGYLGAEWYVHGYKTSGAVYDVLEDGDVNFVYEFYEAGGGAHVSFSCEKICDLTYTPQSLAVAFSKYTTNISWDANGNTTSAHYSWAVYNAENSLIQSGNTADTSVAVPDLNDGADYYFTVNAYNNCGSSPTSTSSIFTTPNVIRLLTVDVKKTNNTSVTCGGNILKGGASPVTARGVCWSTSPNPTIDDNKTTDGTGIGSYTSTIGGLSENQTYYVRAYATNDNETAYGDEIAFSSSVSVELGVFYKFQNDSASTHIYVDKPENVSITEQGICWSVYPYPTLSDSKNTLPVITDAVEGTTYYVRPYINCNGAIFYGNQQTEIFKYVETGLNANYDNYDYGMYSLAGTYNEKPYFSNEDGLYISYMNDHWAWGLGEDYGEVWLEFDSSYDTGNPPTTGWYSLMITQKAEPRITYNTTTLIEEPSDNGSFNSTFTITHNNANEQSFAGVDNEDFISTGKVIIHNLPHGLSATAIRNNALQVTLNITGTVTPHADVNDDFTGSIAVEFQNNAFANGDNTITAGNSTGLNIDFTGTEVVTGAINTPYNITPVALVKNKRLMVYNLPQDATIRVYDVIGKMIVNEQNTDKNSYETELKSYGIYLVQVAVKNKNWNFKCVNN